MTSSTAIEVDPSSLNAGNIISHCGKVYTVLLVAETAELGGHGVLGVNEAGKRLWCYYTDLAPAQLLSTGGA